MGVSFTLDDSVVDGAADEVLARMPQAQDGFQGPNDEGAAAPQSTPPQPSGDGEKDSAGVAWSADIHATGRDGKGVKTASGEWRKKRKSRVGGTPAQAAAAAKQATDASGKVVLTDAQKAQAMQAGIVVAECVFQMCQAFGGNEWAPREKPIDERANMQGAWGQYFVAKGVTDMPPSLVLCVALGGYMLPRFTQREEFPQTQTRVQRFKEWVGVRLHRLRERREAAKNRAKSTREIDVTGEQKEGAKDANA